MKQLVNSSFYIVEYELSQRESYFYSQYNNDRNELQVNFPSMVDQELIKREETEIYEFLASVKSNKEVMKWLLTTMKSEEVLIFTDFFEFINKSLLQKCFPYQEKNLLLNYHEIISSDISSALKLKYGLGIGQKITSIIIPNLNRNIANLLKKLNKFEPKHNNYFSIFILKPIYYPNNKHYEDIIFDELFYKNLPENLGSSNSYSIRFKQ